MWLLCSWAWAGWPAIDVEATQAPVDGSRDAALVIGIEDYLLVPDVKGAADSARDWKAYLARRGVPAAHTFLLLNAEANETRIRARAAEVAAMAGPDARVWFVFVGHGAPSPDGRDGLLVGADAAQDAETLVARSVPRSELLASLASQGADVVAILDTCFSGSVGGAPLVPGLQPLVPTYSLTLPTGTVSVATAAKIDQFAGPLPGEKRPAFSYLLLGAAQGWGDANGDGTVTLAEATAYADRVLVDQVRDRRQTPSLEGFGDVVLGHGALADPLAVAPPRSATPPPAARAPKPLTAEAEPKKRKNTGYWVAGGSLLAAAGASGVVALTQTRSLDESRSIGQLNNRLASARTAQGVMVTAGLLGAASLTIAVVR